MQGSRNVPGTRIEEREQSGTLQRSVAAVALVEVDFEGAVFKSKTYTIG
jgi:hypothetical protein